MSVFWCVFSLSVLILMCIAYLYPNMIHFDPVDFSERFYAFLFFFRSVY